MSKKSKKGYKQIIKSQEPMAVQTARTSEFQSRLHGCKTGS